jgi:hypothetical protein
MKIEPVLAAWLEPYRHWSGQICGPTSVSTWRGFLIDDRKAADNRRDPRIHHLNTK